VPLHSIQMSYAGGELSPLISHRFDLEPYALGARTLENIIVTETGALTRRPGTYHADDATTKGNAPAYLLAWVYNHEDSYVLEFTPLKIRVYRDHGLVESAPGVPLEIDTPFTATELPYLQVWQSGDVLWIRSQSRWNYKLTRTSHTVWTLADSYPDDGPWRQTNVAATTIYPSNVGKPGTYTVLHASADVFEPEHVDSAWRLDHILPERAQEKTFTAEAEDTNSLLVAKGGEWEFSVQVAGGAAAEATIELQYSLDGATFSTYRSVSVLRAANDTSLLEIIKDRFLGRDERIEPTPMHTGENAEDRAIYLRAACTSHASGMIKTTIKAKPYTHSGIIWLTFYTSARQMGGEIVVSPASTDPTADWAEGAVNGVRGYWRALGFNAERLVLAGTEDEPLRIDAGVAGDYDRFDPGFADDTDAFNITLSQSRQNRIQWINGEWTSSMLVGTEGGIVELRPLSGAGGFTPTNWPAIYRTLRRRMTRIPPAMVDDVLIAPGGVGAQRCYQIYHSTERGGLVADDLTRYARHIGRTGFVGLAVQEDPDQILWLPRADGVMAACSFAYGATAWHRHQFGQGVISHCTVPTPTGDELWLCVERLVGAETRYFIEYMGLVDLEAEIEDGHYLDCAEVWDGGDPAVVYAVTRTDPAVVHLVTWPTDSNGDALADGDTVRFIGHTDLQRQIFQVYGADAEAHTLQLKDVTGAVVINGELFTDESTDVTLEWVRAGLSGLAHLANQTELALVDGQERPITIDAVGAFTLGDTVEYDSYARTVRAGISYTSLFVSLPLEFYLRSGTTVGMRKQLSQLTLSLYRSYGGEYGVSTEQYQALEYRRSAAQTGAGPFLCTEDKNLPPIGGMFSGELNVTVRCTGAYPFTIRGMAPVVEVH